MNAVISLLGPLEVVSIEKKITQFLGQFLVGGFYGLGFQKLLEGQIVLTGLPIQYSQKIIGLKVIGDIYEKPSVVLDRLVSLTQGLLRQSQIKIGSHRIGS